MVKHLDPLLSRPEESFAEVSGLKVAIVVNSLDGVYLLRKHNYDTLNGKAYFDHL